jgi:predicted RNase H-like HicB family nuclease
MIVYPAKFERAKDGITVTFPGIPEAIACGYSEAEAAEYAVDALETVFSEYIKRRRAIPRPRAHAKGTRPIALPTLAEAKIRLYEAMRQAGVRRPTWRAAWDGKRARSIACSTCATARDSTRSRQPWPSCTSGSPSTSRTCPARRRKHPSRATPRSPRPARMNRHARTGEIHSQLQLGHVHEPPARLLAMY